MAPETPEHEHDELVTVATDETNTGEMNDHREGTTEDNTSTPANRRGTIEQLKRWLREQLSSPTAQKATAGIALAVLTYLIFRKKYGRKRLSSPSKHTGRKREQAYRSANAVPLSVFLAVIQEGRLQRALLGTSRIFFQDSEKWARFDLPQNNPTLQKEIFARLSKAKKADVSVLNETDYSSLATAVLAVLPFVYLGLLYRMMRNQLGDNDAHQKRMQERKHQSGVTFADVAGLDNEVTEVAEIVEYLRNPQIYRNVGAASPNAVLLYGPPGTGKTLLAQAVAGEADVDCFLACNASDFVELYVGRGASRVRSLFASVRKEALSNWRSRTGRNSWYHWIFSTSTTAQHNEKPCCAILFIDELDALAKTRATIGSNDEREQTLNQLLTEMDGFVNNKDVTVIVMAASNRADVLDPAILRRFDRKVHVGYPSTDGRQAIMRVHARRINLEDTVDFEYLAETTHGMSGADLRNVVNEAALLAVREGSNERVAQRHLELAATRIRAMRINLESRPDHGLFSLRR